MTNKEKYKTPEERTKAFGDFCSLHESCVNCSMDGSSAVDCACAYAWLELEYKEELLPCPFCGGTHIEIYDDYSKLYRSYRFMCKNCKVEVVINAQSKEEAIKKWNRGINND